MASARENAAEAVATRPREHRRGRRLGEGQRRRGDRQGQAAPARRLARVGVLPLARPRRRADRRGRGRQATVAVAIYAASLSALFGVSALYHRINWQRPEVRRWMRRLDHTMIFLLIAGTITPFALLVMEGALRQGAADRRLGGRAGGDRRRADLGRRAEVGRGDRLRRGRADRRRRLPGDRRRGGPRRRPPDRRSAAPSTSTGASIYARRAPRPQPRRLRLPRDLPRAGDRRRRRALRRDRLLRAACAA